MKSSRTLRRKRRLIGVDDGIGEAAGAGHDGNAAIAQAVELCKAAGFETRWNEDRIGTCLHEMRKRFVITGHHGIELEQVLVGDGNLERLPLCTVRRRGDVDFRSIHILPPGRRRYFVIRIPAAARPYRRPLVREVRRGRRCRLRLQELAREVLCLFDVWPRVGYESGGGRERCRVGCVLKLVLGHQHEPGQPC